jgi:hypothetical protein
MNERNDIRPDNTSSSPSEKSAPLGEHQPIEADTPALSAHGEYEKSRWCRVRSYLMTTSAQVDRRRCGSSDAPSRPKASP